MNSFLLDYLFFNCICKEKGFSSDIYFIDNHWSRDESIKFIEDNHAFIYVSQFDVRFVIQTDVQQFFTSISLE